MATFGTSSGIVFRFEKYELRPDVEELRKRGTLIPLAPQPFRVLLLLISRQGQVVTREEIQEALWGSSTFVDYEQGINAVIRRIRTALNDHAETPRFLQTVPRRGYCFVVPVERIVPEDLTAALESMMPPAPFEVTQTLPFALPAEDVAPASRRLSPATGLFVAMLVAASALFATRGPYAAPEAKAAAGKPLHIAVSAPRSEGPQAPSVDPRSFSAELRSRLSLIQPQRIALAEPGAEADLRIDSTLRNTVDGLRVDAKIVDVRTGASVWTENFTRARGELNDFPLEVALRVARAVGERYLPRPRQQPLLRAHVAPRALALYREGRAILEMPQPQRDDERARVLFEKAVKLEPGFAEAWSAIGEVWAIRASVWMGMPSQNEAVEEARKATQRALALDPRISEAHNNLGMLQMQFDHQYVAAERQLRLAIEADPDYLDAHYNLALLLAAMGQHEGAIAEFRRLQLLDPTTHVPSTTLAFIYLMGHRFNDAHAEYHACQLVLRRPEISNWGMMSSSIGARNWDDATTALSAVLARPVVLARNSPDRAAAFRKELRALESSLLRREHAGLDPYVLACFYAQVLERDKALAALDRAVKMKSLNAAYAFVDPRLVSLRGDPRFGKALYELGFR